MKARLEAAGLEPYVMNSTNMMKLIRVDAERLGVVAKEANIQAE